MSNLDVLLDAPILVVQLVVSGILVGAIFALVAYGMALVWGVMNIINIAQGEFVMLGGYVVFYLDRAGVHPLFGIPIAAMVMYGVGDLLYRVVIRRIVDRDMFMSILATFGISILLQQLANQLFSADIRTVSSGLPSLFLAGGMVTIPEIKLAGFVAAVAVGVALVVFLRRHAPGSGDPRDRPERPRRARPRHRHRSRLRHHLRAQCRDLRRRRGAGRDDLVHPALPRPHLHAALVHDRHRGGSRQPAGVIVAGAGLGVVEEAAGFLLGAEYQTAFVFLLLIVILIGRNLLLARQRRYLK